MSTYLPFVFILILACEIVRVIVLPFMAWVVKKVLGE